MRHEVANNLKWSSEAFDRLVWPQMRLWYPGKLAHIESVADTGFASDLDRLAGIDAMIIDTSRGVRAVASRVQACPPQWASYDTFTTRYRTVLGGLTEYDKRKAALESGGEWLYPHLTVQAYVTNKTLGSELRSFGVVETRALISKIDAWLMGGAQQQPDIGFNRHDNEFIWVRWTDYLCSHIFRSPSWSEPTATHGSYGFWPTEPPPGF